MKKTVQKSPVKYLKSGRPFITVLLLSVLLLPSLLIPVLASAMVIEDFTVHMQIMEMTKAREPFIVSGHAIFSYEQPKHDQLPRYVAAAFDHEGFSQLHVFSVNQHGLFVLALPLPDNTEQLIYRLRVDSIWLPDPTNPESLRSQRGYRLSRLSVPASPEGLYSIPDIDHNNRLVLEYRGQSDQQIYVSGTFNNWDPFMHRMQETTPGQYRITLQVNPRQAHYYVFYVNGQRVLDPRNPEVAYTRHDRQVSAVQSPARRQR